MPAATAEPAAETVWLSRIQAAELLGTTTDVVARLEVRGQLTVRRLPGSRPRYERSSVEALRDASTRHRQPSVKTEGPARPRKGA